MNWRRKFAMVAVPAVLALVGGALAVQAAPKPAASTPATVHSLLRAAQTASKPARVTAASHVKSKVAAAAEATDPAEAGDTGDAAEAPGTPDVGHADPDGVNVDHQFDGNE